MTHPLSSSSVATPTQRNRRLLLTLPAVCALPMLTACGGGADLNYTTEQALYVVGEAITPNTPQLTSNNPNTAGHTAPTFHVTPPLPAGLTLNSQTGVISGTPTKLKRQGSYIVIARNNRGFAETCVRITVTARGAWIPVATVPGPRAAASISRLPGGKFLVAGGVNGESISSAEIYDASSATWSAAAPMLAARNGQSAVVLNNGLTLVIGGDSESPEYGATELYDPETNAWTATGRLNEPRSLCTAHLLANGKVLVVGGIDVAFQALNTAELYDPVTRLWTLMPTRLSVPRALHAAALLADGKTLLVAGGFNATTAELYKVDGSGTKAIPYGLAGNNHRAVKLDDGSVLVTSSGSNLSKRYNPVTSSWTTGTLMGGARNFPAMTVLADGRVLLAGGWDVNSAEIYNPDVNRWTDAAPMVSARTTAVAALLGDGSVLVVGGDSSTGIIDASERYIP